MTPAHQLVRSSAIDYWAYYALSFCLINDSGCSTYSSVHCLAATEHFLLQPLVYGTVFHHTSLLPPLSSSSAVVLNHISSHFLIPLSDSSLICTVPAQWLFVLGTIIVIAFNIYHYRRVPYRHPCRAVGFVEWYNLRRLHGQINWNLLANSDARMIFQHRVNYAIIF